MQELRANTQVIVTVGPFVDVGNGFTPQIDIDILTTDEAELMKHGETLAVDISGRTWAVATMAGPVALRGYFSLTLTTADTNKEGMLLVIVQDDSDALPVKQEYMVLSQAAWDSKYVAKDTGFMDVNVKAVAGTEARATELALIAQYLFANAVDLTNDSVVKDNSVIASMIATAGDISGYVKATDAQQVIRDTIGAPAALDSGAATLGGMLAKLADDNDGADFDAGSDSQRAIAATITGSASTGSASHEPVVASPGGFVLTEGLNETNNEDSTRAFGGTEHTWDDDGAGNLQGRYLFDIGGAFVPTNLEILGRLNGAGGDEVQINVNTGTIASPTFTPATNQRGSIIRTGGATNTPHFITLFNTDIMTGADAGKVQIQIIDDGGVSGATFAADQIFVSKTSIASRTGYSLGAVWLDLDDGTAGTVADVNGTADNPCLTLVEARSIMTSKNLHRLHIAPTSTVLTLASNTDGFEFFGEEWVLALNGKSCARAVFIGAHVTGICTGAEVVFKDCDLAFGGGTISFEASVEAHSCALSGDLTMTTAGTYFFDQCYSAIAGTGTPSIDFEDANENKNLNFRHYSGGIEIKNMGQAGSTDNMSLEGDGQLVVNATCEAATIAIRGHFPISGDATAIAAITFSDVARFDVQHLARAKYQTQGTVWFVDTAGNDSDDGLSPNTAHLSPKTTIEAASANDVVLIGPGTFALSTDIIETPNGVSVHGAGMDVTRITSTAIKDTHGAIFKPGSNSETSDMTIEGTLTDGTFQVPFGTRGGGTPAQATFVNAIGRRLRLVADTDGAFILNQAAIMTLIDCLIDVKFDGVAALAASSVITVIDTQVTVIGPSASGSEESRGMTSANGGLIRSFNCNVSAVDAVSETHGYQTQINSTIEVYGGTIYTSSSTGNVFDAQDKVGTTILSGVAHNGAKLSGTVVVTAERSGYTGGAVYLDLDDGFDGNNGMADAAVKTLARAKVLYDALNLKRVHVAPSRSTVTLADATEGMEFFGERWKLALGNQSITNSVFRGCDVSGVSSAQFISDFIDCNIDAISVTAGNFLNCVLRNTITFLNFLQHTYRFENCKSQVNAVLDFASGGNDTVYMPGWKGSVLEVQNMAAGDTQHIEGEGALTINANCAGGTINPKGNIQLTNNGSAAVNEDARVTLSGVADAAWDEVLSTSEHNTAQTAGKRLRQITAAIISNDTAEVGNSPAINQIQLASGESAVDGTFDPGLVGLVGGTGAGQCRLILEYEGSTKLATLNRDWKVAPDATTEYIIMATAGGLHVNEGLAQGGGASSITLNSLASSTDNLYNGQFVFLVSGPGQDQVARVTAYNGTSKVATISTTSDGWATQPTNATGYIMVPILDIVPTLLGSPAGASVSADIAAIQADLPSTGTGARTIAVTVNDGAAVLENATVRFTEGANTYAGPTDASGEISFSLDDATYAVAVSKPGYTFTPTTLVVDGDKTPTYSMTAVSITAPPNAATTTGVMTVYDEEGSVESGVTITVQVIDGPGTAGIGYDSTEWAATSNGSGVVEFAGIILGARYKIWRGTSKPEAETFTAPTTGTSFNLTEVIGRG